MEAMAARSATFFTRGSASRAGNAGREMVGEEELEPRVTGGLVGMVVAAATVAGENLTMVSR